MSNFKIKNLFDSVCFLIFSAVQKRKLSCDDNTNDRYDEPYFPTVRTGKSEISQSGS